jgi:GDP-L-fucose synthase
LASACYFLLQNYNEQGFINIGYGSDITISELAELIALEENYKGVIEYDVKRLDGTPRKLLNLEKINNLGWKPKIEIKVGLRKTIIEYLDNII